MNAFSHRFVTAARLVFFALQTLMAIALVLLPVGLLPLKRAGGTVHFTMPESLLRVKPDTDATAKKVTVSDLSGFISVRADGSMAASLQSHRRWTETPQMLALLGLGFVVCRSLRRLCHNIERGQVFTDVNLKLVRTAGLAFVLGGLAASALEVWAVYQFAQLMATYVSFESVQLLHPPPGWRIFFEGYIDSLVTGILLLALAEVFRHGLRLQQETELTV
jgi:hypothetical protein